MNDTLGKPHNSPWKDLLTLLLVTFGLSLALQLPLVLIGLFLSGDINGLSEDTGSLYAIHPYFTYLVFMGGTLGTFLLPAYYYYRKSNQPGVLPSQGLNRVWTYVLSVLFLLAFVPLMSLVSDWNLKMTLPESFRGIEQWMRVQEDQMTDIMSQIIMVDRVDLLLMNVLAIAVLPAIGEEFFFRGALQHIFKRIFGNTHITIWVVAIIFSAIHMQFYGFFPRMLLGVFFGYMLLWTGNIWVPIFAHFVNNASVVIMAFYYARQGKTYEELSASESFPIIVYLGSIILSIGLAYLSYQYSTKNKLYGKRMG